MCHTLSVMVLHLSTPSPQSVLTRRGDPGENYMKCSLAVITSQQDCKTDERT